MKVISLQSGSNGNAFFVECSDVRLLFDAGITGRQAQLRLAAHGRDICDCQALFLSHDHSDHARYVGVYHRKFGLPVYLTQKTLKAAQRYRSLGALSDVRFFQSGQSVRFPTGCGSEVTVHTIPTPHDSAEGSAFVVEFGEKRVGILTDLGHAFAGLRDVLLSLDAVVIESNYDEAMLDNGPYPEMLKRRIRGRGGHLSNRECAQLLSDTRLFRRLKWACLCHLSEENNHPELAAETARNMVGKDIAIHVASRHDASGVFEV